MKRKSASPFTNFCCTRGKRFLCGGAYICAVSSARVMKRLCGAWRLCFLRYGPASGWEFGRALSRRRARIFFKRGPAGLARGIDLSRSRGFRLGSRWGFFWSAVPEQNAVICFSTATKRIALRISGGTQRAFDGPCSLVRYGRVLYVCNERSHQISTLSLDRYAVRDYQHFQEPVYKFFRWQKEEIAVLASGVYLL